MRGDRAERQAISFSPIRITPILIKPIDRRFQVQLTDPKGPLMRALNYLENTLRVRPIHGSFTIPPSCNEYTFGPNKGKCRFPPTTTQCGIFNVPQQFVGAREVCSTSSSTCYESGPNGAGATNTDYLLFVGTACMYMQLILIF